MSAPTIDKPSLHKSGIDKLMMCGELYDRENIRGIRYPPKLELVRGLAVHKSREIALRTWRDEKLVMLTADVQEAAANAFDAQVEEQDIALEDDEGVAADKGRVRALGKDQSVSLAEALNRDVPVLRLRPVLVEESVRVSFPGLKHDLEGTIDDAEEGHVLVDTKTSKKKKTPTDIASSIEYPFYSLLYEVRFGVKPSLLAMDAAQILKRGDKAYRVTAPAPENHDRIATIIHRVETILEKGAFQPAHPGHWKCSPKYCAHWNDCPFGARGRIAVSMSTDEE